MDPLMARDNVVEALVDQQKELATVLEQLDAAGWHAPTRCDGWDVADVVLHLAQSDEMALASVSGTFTQFAEAQNSVWTKSTSVDNAAELMVEKERGGSTTELLERWTNAAGSLTDVLCEMDLSTKVPWIVKEMSARTLAATRLSETWIHCGDIAEAVDIEVVADDRLWFIARLAWRTLPYAFANAGKTMHGEVDLVLQSPSGEVWEFASEGATSTVTGSAMDLCAVAARRLDPVSSSLQGKGPDADDVLSLIRTYAA
jgi:uncharacterized protein (TIGR03084 family)